VILGGGFAGVTTAQELERRFGPAPTVTFTLISETNALLFTPMLAEVAGSSLEPTHISHPLRSALRRTAVVRGQITRIDLAGRRIILAADQGGSPREVPYDELVLALGAVSNFLGLAGVQAHAFDFKSLWALGDCAEVPNAHDGQPSPPTAQFALRQAKLLAKNLHASRSGGALKPFRFAALGVLAVIGHQTACAELTIPLSGGKTVRFSGLLAWLMWRGIYLSKLPGLERQVRVLTDWVIELFFPRDIVQTIDLQPAPAMFETAQPVPQRADVVVPARPGRD